MPRERLLARPADKNKYGYLSEHHSYGETAKKAGEYAEDLAATMLATTLGIAKNTLSKYFAAELEAGQQEAKLQVGTFILDSILGRGGIRDDRARATLAIFYAKTRMGWKETSIHRHGEAPPEDPDAALEALTRGFDRLAARKGKTPPTASPNGSAAASSEMGVETVGEAGATIASR